MAERVTMDNDLVEVEGDVTEPRAALVHGLGELSLRLVRDWAPLLKPAGVGLLTTIHAWEEQNPRNPFYGWMHVAQETLAAYLDMGRTSIIRYRNLLDTCGLLEQREVSYRRPGMKLHQTVLRVSRAEVQPSLRLLEYLIFEADDWTRKHTAWLLHSFQPVGDEGELGRLVAVMRRAYQVRLDGNGIANIVNGERLTAVGSFAERLMQKALASQPQLLEVENEKLKVESHDSDVSAVNIASSDGVARKGQGSTRIGSSVSPRVKEGAGNVSSGVGGERSVVSSGVNNVNDSSVLNAKENENVNVAADNDFAFARQGAMRIGDEGSISWHIACLQRIGPALYEQAIAATERVIAAGKLRGRSGSYFTRTAQALARQRGIALDKGRGVEGYKVKVESGGNAASGVNNGGRGFSPEFAHEENGHGSDVSPLNTAFHSNEVAYQQSNVSAVNNGSNEAAQYIEPGMAARQAWQAALAELEGSLSGAAWSGWLRHARLLQLDGNVAVVGTPSGGLAELMARRHSAEVVEVFSAVLGRRVEIEFVTRW